MHNLTDAELNDLRAAYAGIMRLSDTRGYSQAAGLHGYPNNWCWHHHQRSRQGSPTELSLFLPWHRAYLYDFEMRLRDINPNVTVAWWDWTKSAEIPAAFSEPTAPDGTPNSLYAARMDFESQGVHRMTMRQPQDSPLPVSADVDPLLEITDFNEFSDQIESQLHDWVHGWVGGDMGQVPTAAYDPIFWAHHAMVDQLWNRWQSIHGTTRMPPNTLDEILDPFAFAVRKVLDVHDLGYEYVASASEVVAPEVGG